MGVHRRAKTDDDIIKRCEIFRQLRRETRAQFSISCGLAEPTYSNFINSQKTKPSVALVRGATLLGISPGWLLTGIGSIMGNTPRPCPLCGADGVCPTCKGSGTIN